MICTFEVLLESDVFYLLTGNYGVDMQHDTESGTLVSKCNKILLLGAHLEIS